MSLDLDFILLAVAGGAASYFTVEKFKSQSIRKAADRMVFDCCVKRIDGELLEPLKKEDFKVTGYHSYKAIERYNKIYNALHQLDANAASREIEKLFKVE
ncbi:MAG: hypothetical protein AABX31_03185 [Nanoarchaeota archaeon]